jgi:ABC-2 type transport system ATP-binding protein
MVKAVETRDLVKRYEDVEAIKGITLDIEEGEFFGFLGPNVRRLNYGVDPRGA